MEKEPKPSYKWTLLALISSTYFLAQGTRQIYNTVLPQIKADFAAAGAGLSDTEFGLVGSVFTLVFGIVMPLGGFFADFFSRKWMIVIGTVLFSIGIFMSGFAAGLGLLLGRYQRASEIGCDLKLAGCSARTKKILELSGADKLFDFLAKA